MMLLNYWGLVLMLFLARLGWVFWTHARKPDGSMPRVTWSKFFAAVIVNATGLLLFAVPVHEAITLLNGWVNQ